MPGMQQGKPPCGWGLWARKLGSILVLIASVTALSLILLEQYGETWLGQGEARASTSYATLAESPGGRGAASRAAPTQAEEARYQALSEFVARRYRVSQDVAFYLVSQAHRVGEQFQLDPLLIIAVIAIESRFNPIAESVAGAKGLMQIIPKYHGDKLDEFGGEHAVFDPAANIHVGAQILKEYLHRTGNLSVALQKYAGALDDSEDQYTRKVLNEKQRLQQVVSGVRSPSASPAAVETAAVRMGYTLVLPTALD